MSSDNALISVSGLGKAYPIFGHPIDRLKHLLVPSRQEGRQFWAVKNIDLSLARGETMGIIGRNGAGKSTLLQMICGTLSPTVGTVRTAGRISALLELGAGFNPDFTGRENVYLYGSVLGLKRSEIERNLDAILAFAEIGEFIDMPVKTYSSGMFVRLAFSVAINVEPDILIVDEALAVGDARFQHKCMTRIRQMQDNGVAILYVSHDTEGVKRLCKQVIALHDGQVVKSGDPSSVANWYLAFAASDFDLERFRTQEAQAKAATDADGDQVGPVGASLASPLDDVEDHIRNNVSEFEYFRYGDGSARFTSIHITDAAQKPLHSVQIGEAVDIHFRMQFHEDRIKYGVGFFVRDTLGTNLIGINTFQEGFDPTPASADSVKHLRLRLPIELKPGYYSISPSIAYDQDVAEWMDYIDNAVIFRVVDSEPKRTVFGVYLPAFRAFDEL